MSIEMCMYITLLVTHDPSIFNSELAVGWQTLELERKLRIHIYCTTATYVPNTQKTNRLFSLQQTQCSMNVLPTKLLSLTHIVDLMEIPGELYPIESRKAFQYLQLL